jgi:hypothetical protein
MSFFTGASRELGPSVEGVNHQDVINPFFVQLGNINSFTVKRQGRKGLADDVMHGQ